MFVVNSSIEYGHDTNTMFLKSVEGVTFHEFVVTKIRDRFFITASMTSLDKHYEQNIMTFEMQKDTDGYNTLLKDMDTVSLAQNDEDVKPILNKLKKLLS